MLLIRSKRVREIAGVLETANFLLLKLLIKNRAGARSFPGRVFRDYMSLAGQDRWRSLPVERLLPDFRGARITLEHMPGEGIETAIDELAYLALLTRVLEPDRIFEIGTFRGRTALNFALNSPPACRIYTLDLPPGTWIDTNPADAAIIKAASPGADFEGKDVAYKIEQLYGDSTTFDFSPYVGQMDIVFVDGAHHYAAARSDTVNALELARPGGMIIWHDFANYGDYNDVTRAVLDVVPGDQVVELGATQLAVHIKNR
jgi:predicted O-methyltransferase YrrM